MSTLGEWRGARKDIAALQRKQLALRADAQAILDKIMALDKQIDALEIEAGALWSLAKHDC